MPPVRTDNSDMRAPRGILSFSDNRLAMQGSAASAFVLLFATHFLTTYATDLWLYNDDDYDKHKTFKRFNFGTSQRCYNIVDCFNNKASSASWINAPKAAWLAFYDDKECTGTQYVSKSTPSGEMKFAPVGLDNKISSFMQWEYATFALKGFVDICNDAAILTVNATSNGTDIGDAEAGYELLFELSFKLPPPIEMNFTPLIYVFTLVLAFVTNTQAMTLTLYGGPDEVRTFDVDEVTQRCYNLYACWGGPNKSATWDSVKSRTNVVFYSHPNCQTHQAVGKGTPDGSLYFSDVNFPQVVMAFMIWESGQFATRGIEDICYQDERAITNSTNAI